MPKPTKIFIALAFADEWPKCVHCTVSGSAEISSRMMPSLPSKLKPSLHASMACSISSWRLKTTKALGLVCMPLSNCSTRSRSAPSEGACAGGAAGMDLARLAAPMRSSTPVTVSGRNLRKRSCKRWTSSSTSELSTMSRRPAASALLRGCGKPKMALSRPKKTRRIGFIPGGSPPSGVSILEAKSDAKASATSSSTSWCSQATETPTTLNFVTLSILVRKSSSTGLSPGIGGNPTTIATKSFMVLLLKSVAWKVRSWRTP
mmetsp:Transcript_118104/g.341466  ORF Transcript_118104/g.341466 Transcript_118104/m.341466 type:complete len:261 (+) Transcript_118104:86-868(+)